MLIASAHGSYLTMYEEDIDLQMEVSHHSFVLFAHPQNMQGKRVAHACFFRILLRGHVIIQDSVCPCPCLRRALFLSILPPQ